MGLIITLWRAFAAFSLLFLLTVHGVILFGIRDASQRKLPERAPMIVVLGAGMAADGTLGANTVVRLEAALDLAGSGVSDRLHFAGGDGWEGATEGRLMARIAKERLPEAIVTFEEKSRSTLQNAYFTVQGIGPIPSGSILVTDATHLFRAWAALQWAGAGSLELYPARPFPEPFMANLHRSLREAAGTWLNIGRSLNFAWLRFRGVEKETAAVALADQPDWLPASAIAQPAHAPVPKSAPSGG